MLTTFSTKHCTEGLANSLYTSKGAPKGVLLVYGTTYVPHIDIAESDFVIYFEVNGTGCAAWEDNWPSKPMHYIAAKGSVAVFTQTSSNGGLE